MENQHTLVLERKFNLVFFVLITIIFIFALNFLVLSLPGDGLNNSPNVAIWFLLSIIIFISIFKIILLKKIRLPALIISLVLTCCVLILGGMLETNSDLREIILRVMQVIGFCLVYFSFSQFTFSQAKINKVFYIVILSANIQIIYCMAQLFHNPEITPDFLMPFLGRNSPPIGGLLQINMMSMFMSMSLLLSLFLYSQPSFNNEKSIKKISLLIAMFGCGFLILVISSRASFLALIISLPILVFARWKGMKKNKVWGLLLITSMLLGAFFGSLNEYRKVSDKTTMPRTVVWSITLDAIKEKPILGYGLGGFTKAFYDQNEKYVNGLDNEAYKVKTFFEHPHNEILYWWIESGLFGVIALIGIALFYFRLLLKLRWRYSSQYLALIIPIALHTQVSYPFYLATILMVLFLFILSIPLRSLGRIYELKIKESFKKVIMISSFIIFFGYVWFLKQVVIGGMNMTKFGISGLRDFTFVEKELNNPYWGKLSEIFIRQELMKTFYSNGKKESALEQLIWFEKQIKSNERPIYYKALLTGYKIFDQKEKHTILKNKLKNRFPDSIINLE